MNRNREVLTSRTQIAAAVRTVYEIAKLLKLDQSEVQRLFSIDVTAHISPVNFPGFIPYADGLLAAYTSVIIREHCEYVYDIDGVKVGVKELIHKGARHSDVNSGYQWKGSEYPFTAFSKEPDPWI